MNRPGPDHWHIGDHVMRSRKGATFTVETIGDEVMTNAAGHQYRHITIRATKSGHPINTTTDRIHPAQ